jgi:phospholipid-transporting ATPase
LSPADILTFIILYNNLILILLIVTMEVVEFLQAQLINNDLDMYYAPADMLALCCTSAGTLTRNEMEFRCCCVVGVAYAETVDDARREGSEDSGAAAGAWRMFDAQGHWTLYDRQLVLCKHGP